MKLSFALSLKGVIKNEKTEKKTVVYDVSDVGNYGICFYWMC